VAEGPVEARTGEVGQGEQVGVRFPVEVGGVDQLRADLVPGRVRALVQQQQPGEVQVLVPAEGQAFPRRSGQVREGGRGAVPLLARQGYQERDR
jgi:hypothetical protein